MKQIMMEVISDNKTLLLLEKIRKYEIKGIIRQSILKLLKLI